MEKPADRINSLYFVNPLVDVAMIGGVSLLTFLGLWAFHDGSSMAAVYAATGALVWVVNWPHFSATSYRLYHRRENILQYPLTACFVPLLLLGALVASLAEPTFVAPYFVKLHLIWSPFHFSGQTLGITMIYARRGGFAVGTWERRALTGFVFGTFVSQSMWHETGIRTVNYYAVTYPTMGIPVNAAMAASAVMYACGAAFLLSLAWRFVQTRAIPPLILFLPALSQYVWFVMPAVAPGFREIVPMFHSLQYLLIAWALQLRENLDAAGSVPSYRYVGKETVRWGVLNVLGGAALFYAFPWLVSQLGYPLAFTTGVVLAAVQIHHFFVDGVIWKLKRTSVSSPLMGSWQALVGRPRLAPETA